jgi:hypothetical protein
MTYEHASFEALLKAVVRIGLKALTAPQVND